MRRSFTAEQKMAIVLEGLRGETSLAEICRRHQISQTQYYNWRDSFLEGGRTKLALKSNSQEEAALKAKVQELERIIGKLTIENEILKKTEEIIGNRRRW